MGPPSDRQAASGWERHPARRMIGFVFDDTALVALLDGNPMVFRLWQHAQQEQIPILVPATAVFAANRRVDASDSAWLTMLHAEDVTVLDLSLASALATSREPGDLVTAHSSFEARHAGATIVTARPLDYPPELRTEEFRAF
jgi:hypothetical protein